MARITVVGAGAWGTALAVQLARNDHHVQLWGRDRESIAELRVERCNSRYLPGVLFPSKLEVRASLAMALKACDWILVAVPSHGFRQALMAIKKEVSPNTPLCWATKGLDNLQGRLLSEVALDILGEEWPIALLSGPSFAKEVALSLPTAVLIGSTHEAEANNMQRCFHSEYFRVYTTEDLVGVQVAGAVKNVIAVATGICDGLQLGANGRAALITRGLAEITRLGLAMGGKQNTFMGLAGMGDLMLTCTDSQSRNYRFGLALAQGEKINEALSNIGQVVEGYSNAPLVCGLAESLKVDMPIVKAVTAIVAGEFTINDAVHQLLAREPGVE